MKAKPVRAIVDVKGLAPGSQLLGLYPQTLFRFDAIETTVCPDVKLVRAGRWVPMDGATHRIEAHERTVCLGNFIALHVVNEASELRPFRCVLVGVTIDEGVNGCPLSLVHGLFIPEGQR